MAYAELDTASWEEAKSNRGTCKKCCRIIPKGNMRLAVWFKYNPEKGGVGFFCVPCGKKEVENRKFFMEKLLNEGKKW